MARYLVTGGAGFVGSHVVLALLDAGCEVTVLDDLSQGHREAVPAPARLVEANLSNQQVLEAVLSDGPWDAVLHFASLSQVGESMREPFRYLLENAGLGMRLVEACVRHEVRRFVLSSTANLFGDPDTIPIDETARIDPSSPYGESKLMLERTLRWAGQLGGLRVACLRYFNAAGADPQGRAGEHHDPETHLIPLAIDACLGRRPPLQVFGRDYPTPDGTCIRDYVHVGDLAQAHLRALDCLQEGSVTFNVGSGTGHSVLEVLDTVGRLVGRPVPHEFAARRPGDPAILVASSARLRARTGWTPCHGSLDAIVGTALAWRQVHPEGWRTRR